MTASIGSGPADHPTCITCGDVALPMRVVRLGGEDGLADCVSEDGQTAAVDVALVDAAPGDAVLVHACVALQRIEEPA
jgi:hydrogenase expression/formation protein HypC